MAEPAPAQAQQQHREVLTLRTERAVTLDDLHFAAMNQSSTTGCHPGPADLTRNFGTPLDGGQYLGIEPVDLKAQLFNVGQLFNVDHLDAHPYTPVLF